MSRLPMDKCLINNPCIRITIRALRWVPVVFITAVMAWAYYAFVFELCFGVVTHIVQRGVYLAMFHVLLAMFVWSYVQTVFTPIAHVPREFYLTQEIKEELSTASYQEDFLRILDRFVYTSRMPLLNRDWNGGARLCMTCSCIKPDRSHHCSVCGFCILKFDHHCPWVNTCINFANYKFFVLFLGYGLYLCLFGFFAILPYFVGFWRGGGGAMTINGGASILSRFHVLFLFFVAGMFGISMGALFFYHLYLIGRNQTTTESFRAPVFSYGVDKNGYNLGAKRNYREIFGSRPLLWLLPIFTSLGDGVRYPQRAITTLIDSSESSLDAPAEVVVVEPPAPLSASSPLSPPPRPPKTTNTSLSFIVNNHHTNQQRIDGGRANDSHNSTTPIEF